MATKLRQVRAQRQLYMDHLEEILTLAQTAVADQSVHVRFKIRYAGLDEIFSDFEKTHASVVALVTASETPDLTLDKESRRMFFDNFYTVKTIYANLFPDPIQVQQNRIEEPTTGSRSSNIKLKPLRIPVFEGEYKEWPTFRDLFRTLIHENNDLKPIEKFQYLLTFLSKEPLKIVKTLALSEANYPIAFQSLEERYDNKRMLASAYCSSLYNLKSLTSASSRSLRLLVDTFQENLAALEATEFPKDLKDFLLFSLLLQKVDPATRERFELQLGNREIPTLSALVEFLKKQCNALENVGMAGDKSPGSALTKPVAFSGKQKTVSSLVATSKGGEAGVCNICSGEHPSNRCPAILDKSPSERFKIIKDKSLCLNCFGTHRLKNCRSKINCRKCEARHHTMLHFPQPASTSAERRVVESHPTSISSGSSPSTSTETHSLANVSSSKGIVLLSTARVNVLDAWGNLQPIRALIDNGSQVNILSERCLQRLGLKAKTISMSIFGVGQLPSSASKGVTCTIFPVAQKAPSFTIETVVLPTICSSVPSAPFSIDDWKSIANLKLADPEFNIPGAIDLLIGAELFPSILRDGRLVGSLPTAVNTAFGWIVMGKIPATVQHTTSTSLFVSANHTLEGTLKKFWELEEVPNRSCASPEDLLCEKTFVEKHSRGPDGRYCVALPFKGPKPILGDSRSGALKQFYSLENRLRRDPGIGNKYRELIEDYVQKGYLELAATPPSDPRRSYYIPHHCVFNPGSSTTPIRIVFNASFKTTDGNSLNDNLLVGPKLQNDIATLLLNFRLHRVAFTADIRQMYLQINIIPSHADYQRILWRSNPTGPVQDYRWKTVVFGVTSSPFLAIRTLLQLAEDEQQSYPLASRILRSDTFVDDVVSGCSSLEEALEVKDQLIALLLRGKFELRKWSSSSTDFLQSIPEEHRQNSSLCFDDKHNSMVKVLGLRWLPHNDVFTYSVEPTSRSCTKRSILSELARIFDPLGFLSPLTFFTKFLIQQLWTLGLDWDQEPPGEILERWTRYRSELSCLLKLNIPRPVISVNWSVCQLHAFADSSEKGYAGVVYLRFEVPNGDVHISLICAKSKVAPLKRISIPRLELCAAVLVAKLVDFVVKTFSDKISIDKIFAWTDSSVTLSWIKSSPHRWKTFVSNRVSIIQESVSPELWHHVRSSDNPADCASRGLLPLELLEFQLWWKGPTWLSLPESDWPTSNLRTPMQSNSLLEEEKKIVLPSFVSLDCIDALLEKYSSLAKIKRIIAYVLRFVRSRENGYLKGAFTAEELHSALLLLVKRVQHLSFAEILNNLEKNKPIPKAFRKLNVFVAKDGLLRVGGRLSHSTLLYDQRHPAILPRNHRLTHLIIEEVHLKHMHPGLQTLQFLLVQNFWILSPRRAIHHVLSKCLRCFRVRPTPYQPPMGNLPALRVSQIKPFQIVGVDFGGPFYITLGRVRAAKVHKAYLCLFVCFATKALHLELASDLTTECFIAALRRLVARRGRCCQIVSDQGTNFVGAKRELMKLMQQAVESEDISWNLNPPSGPHFAGLAEAGIKSVKTHLSRVIGDQILTYEELNTVLVQIEAMLNSRPLCPLSPDPHDFSVLTPGHFLILEPLTTVADPDLEHLPLKHLSRWQLIQRLQQDFWRRWHAEYLHTLQQRSKWFHSNAPKISEGTVVVIKNELCPPLKWRLGRISKLHPGSDGISRVATVRTVNGEVQRPLVKLCPLPFEN